MLTLKLLAAIVIRCIVVARNAKSQLDAYICVGVAGMLVFPDRLQRGDVPVCAAGGGPDAATSSAMAARRW